MDIAKGVHLIPTQTAKHLYLYLLSGKERNLLIDSGTAKSPEQVILPYMDRSGINAKDPLDIIITHADCDHCGGNFAMRRQCPNCFIYCSALDKKMIEEPDLLMEERYEAYEKDHGLAYNNPTKEWLTSASGRSQRVDSVLRSGQRFTLERDWEVVIYPLAGHTLGHMMIWDERHRTAFVGDGVLGHGEYDLSGHLFAPPTYVTVKGYLDSISFLKQLKPEILLRSHCDPITGVEVAPFLEESKMWVQAAEAYVMHMVQMYRDITLKELVDLASHDSNLGDFIGAMDLMYAFHAHLTDLQYKGKIHAKKEGSLEHYFLS